MTTSRTELIWIFGYGSLMWRPGFVHKAQQKAKLYGAHRSFCMRSVDHRGTYQRPGIVLGLIPGGSCTGMAFGVTPDTFEPVRTYLAKREWAGIAYHEVYRQIQLDDGAQVKAMTYLVNPDFENYAPGLSEDEIVDIARDAHGESGPNIDYIINTQAHLVELGIKDAAIGRMAKRLQQIKSNEHR